MLKPDLYLQKHNIRSTVVVFGSTRIVEPAAAEARLQEAREALHHAPNDRLRQCAVAQAERLLEWSPYYDKAAHVRPAGVGGLPTSRPVRLRGDYRRRAGHHGSSQPRRLRRGRKSIGLNIRLPREQQPNPYITPDLCFQFHYFAMRKLHFLLRAKALVAFPGGFGTFDELFDALTLRQNGRMQKLPVILFGPEYWRRAVNFQYLADQGVISDEDLDLLNFADTAEEAWGIIRRFYGEKP